MIKVTTDVLTETALDSGFGATQVSTREVPWMKLGKLKDNPMTAAEAAEAGGLNFKVAKRPVYFGCDGPNPTNEITKITDRVAIVNVDTGKPLGIASKDYPILQYSEAFDFMDAVNPVFVAAGALKGGRQGFMVVKAPDALTLMPDVDPHDLFTVLRTSHDCTRAIEVSVMPLRYRCMNQLTLQSFASAAEHRWTVKHTSTMSAKLAEAQTALEKLGKYAKQFENTAKRLMDIKVTDDKAESILKFVLPDRPKRNDQIDQIISRWHTAETVGFDFTGWGLVNAVSDYFDWGRTGGSPESRFVGALQGQTSKAINRTAGHLLSRV